MPGDDDVARAEIVNAARTYFLRFGYSRVSTDEIVRSVGRSKKTLYRHFETKEALLHAVLERINKDLEARIVAVLADAAPPLRRLEEVLHAVALHVASTAEALSADLRAKSPDLWQQGFGDRREGLVKLLAGVVEQGVAAGVLRDDIAPQAAMRVFLAAAEALAGPLEVALAAGRSPEGIATLVRLTVDGMRRR